MPTDPAALLVHIQLALGLSQQELGALIGRTKRTIQRWQGNGTPMLDEEQAGILAERLRPTHPDLADQVLALGRRYVLAGQKDVTPEVLEAIVGAAAAAGDMSPEGARPLVTAAFAKAAEEGVGILAVVAALRGGG
jgi:phage terminase Nu1 subunit (DNA packaging protein)